MASFALLLSGMLERRQKTSMVAILNRYGWITCDVTATRQILMTVHITAGAYAAVNITILLLFLALQVDV